MNNLDFNFFCSECQQSREYREANCFTDYRTKSYKRGEPIAFTGDRVRDLSLLVRGTIIVSFVLPSGLIIRSTEHTAPYPMGALAIIGRENRYRVDITAKEDCETILVSRQTIEKQIMTCREFMLSFFDYSTSKLDLLVNHIAILSQRNISAKVAYYIFLCSEDGRNYQFKKNIQHLSEYLCIERPSLSRAISKLVDKGLITHKMGKGEILNEKGLRALMN